MVTASQGRISERQAKQSAADATNHAMTAVPRKGRMTGDICGDMVKVIGDHIKNSVKGSRANLGCSTTLGTLPEVTWP